MESLTLEQTASLQDGKCPDCGSTQILAGPQGPGAQNVLCDECKMQFNVPFVRGIPGERIGRLERTPAPVPVQIPHEGFIVQGRGRTNVTAIALHSCQEVYKAQQEFKNEAHGCVDLKLVDEDQAYLYCRSCGMRVSVPGKLRTWNDLVKHFSTMGE